MMEMLGGLLGGLLEGYFVSKNFSIRRIFLTTFLSLTTFYTAALILSATNPDWKKALLLSTSMSAAVSIFAVLIVKAHKIRQRSRKSRDSNNRQAS
jgi:hypothetical protein